jgi:hypothetical protein
VNWTRHLDKLLILISIGMPGLQRLFWVWLVKARAGLEALGYLNNDISLVQMFAYCTAVGWCSLVMVRVPLDAPERRASTLAAILRASWPAQLAGLLAVGVAWRLGYIFHPLPSLLFGVGWTGYQFMRHTRLAIKDYRGTLVLDVGVTLALVPLLWPGLKAGAGWMYLLIAAPQALVTVLGGILLLMDPAVRGVLACRAEPGLARKGWEFGLGNFFSGGLLMLITPLILHCAGAAYAGLYGLIGSVLNILAMAPRALAFYYLPDLSRALSTGSEAVRSLLRVYRHRLWVALGLMAVAVGAGWALGNGLLLEPAQRLPGLHGLFTLMLANLLVSQVALPEANLLMVREETRFLFTLNIVVFALFLAGSLPIAGWWRDTPSNMYALMAVQLVLIGGRWAAQARQAALFFRESSC